MPDAVLNAVDTPSSLANDSQLHQLLSNMHNQLKDIEDNNNDDFSQKIEDLAYNQEVQLQQSPQCSPAQDKNATNDHEIDSQLI